VGQVRHPNLHRTISLPDQVRSLLRGEFPWASHASLLGAKDAVEAYSTISAVSRTAWKSTSQPADAQSLEMSSASLWLRPPTQGHMIIVAGATLAAQQASWPAPEITSMWL